MGLFDLLVNIADAREDAKENAEKRKKAKEMIRKAKSIIDDSNRRYNNKYSSVMDKMNRVEVKVNEHYDFKQQMFNKINNEFTPIIHNFEKFDIDKMTLQSTGSINGGFINNFTCDSNLKFGASNALSGMSITSLISPISFLDYFSDATEEYLNAQSKLREAELYKYEIESQRERLERIQSNLNDVLECISDERSMLRGLSSKLENITNTLNENMKKFSFTQKENEYLKSICKIGKGIDKLMSVRFLNSDFSVSDEYRKISNNMDKIENLMPEQPRIDDTSIKEILMILKDIKVY